MYVYLSKILPVFVMPLSITIFLLLLALIFMRRSNLRLSALFLILAFAVLWISSLPLVANSLYRSIEAQHPPRPLSDIPAGGCIIVLGGVVGPPVAPRVDVELNEGVDRIYKAAELFHAGKAPFVIVTGGNQPWSESKVAEADLIRDLLVKWGVPEESIFLEGSSRNTHENALYTRNVINAINCGSPLLVTSAAHMPRALAAFQSVGTQVTPVSTDVRAVADNEPGLMDFLPSAQALAMTSDALREWVGQRVYKIKGWN